MVLIKVLDTNLCEVSYWVWQTPWIYSGGKNSVLYMNINNFKKINEIIKKKYLQNNSLFRIIGTANSLLGY